MRRAGAWAFLCWGGRGQCTRRAHTRAHTLAHTRQKKLTPTHTTQLGELLDTPPPGVDEAVAISKVVQFLLSDSYAHFDRIVFDTAPTGHTLRLLTLPDFLDASLGKLVRLRAKLTAAADTVKSVFSGGKAPPKDAAVAKMEELRARMDAARALFHDADSTQFVIVTVPTVMAAAESARLAGSLRAEGQYGFRRQRGTAHPAYNLRSLIEQTRAENCQLWACFVDFKQAYDTVPRQQLWAKLTAAGLDPWYLRALQALYASVPMTVRTPAGLSSIFQAPLGVKQSGQLHHLWALRR